MPARTDGGWQIAYRVPFEFVRHFFPGFDPRAGWALRANCYKCGDGTVQAHYLSWNPCTSPAPDFHRPVDFGRMVFGGEKPPIRAYPCARCRRACETGKNEQICKSIDNLCYCKPVFTLI